MSSLSSNSSLLEDGDDILNKLVYFRRAAYFNRMQAKMRIVENVSAVVKEGGSIEASYRKKVFSKLYFNVYVNYTYTYTTRLTCTCTTRIRLLHV
jgi:hypothetical protein